MNITLSLKVMKPPGRHCLRRVLGTNTHEDTIMRGTCPFLTAGYMFGCSRRFWN